MSLVKVLKSEFSSASETCLQMVISGAYQLPPHPCHWDWAGILQVLTVPLAVAEVVRKQQPAVAIG